MIENSAFCNNARHAVNYRDTKTYAILLRKIFYKKNIIFRRVYNASIDNISIFDIPVYNISIENLSLLNNMTYQSLFMYLKMSVFGVLSSSNNTIQCLIKIHKLFIRMKEIYQKENYTSLTCLPSFSQEIEKSLNYNLFLWSIIIAVEKVNS